MSSPRDIKVFTKSRKIKRGWEKKEPTIASIRINLVVKIVKNS